MSGICTHIGGGPGAGALTAKQRLYTMEPRGRAPAAFLAASGQLAAQVNQDVQVRGGGIYVCIPTDRPTG
jgi:hypothetical protein